MYTLDPKELPEYIRDYETIIGKKIEVDRSAYSDLVGYCMELIPQTFESYAAILNPFYISNTIIDELKIIQIDNRFRSLQYGQSYYGVSWFSLYTALGINFNPLDLFQVQGPIESKGRENNGILFPGEGIIEDELIKAILSTSREHYSSINEFRIFFNFLMTAEVTSNYYFSCTDQEVFHIKHSRQFHSGPSIIHTPNEKWLAMTNYDSDVSIIGGETQFIDDLCRKEDQYFVKV